MKEQFRCGDTAALVAYLYNEGEPDEDRAIEAHLLVCAVCADEVEALSITRTQLLSWTPPDAKLDFRIVPNGVSNVASVLRPARWWQRPMPAWAQAAAAALIFGIGLSLGAARGRIAPSASAPPASSADMAPIAATVSTGDLARLEQRLRAEMRQLHASASPVASTSQRGGDAQLLERVRALIQESEDRQQRELALRTTEIIRDFDVQRRGDLARIERTFGQMEGRTGVQVEQQRQMLNYLMRVSQAGQ